jgi:hypothetical protein
LEKRILPELALDVARKLPPLRSMMIKKQADAAACF